MKSKEYVPIGIAGKKERERDAMMMMAGVRDARFFSGGDSGT